MAICKAREAMVDDVAKRAIAELKKTDNKLGGPAIKAKAYALAEEVVENASVLAKEDPTPLVSAAIKANASTAIPLPKNKRPNVIANKHVQALTAAHLSNPSNETINAVINAETAYGYRNAKGELLVNFVKPRVIGNNSKSLEDALSIDEAEAYYTDSDGTIDKSTNINDAMVELDKNNLGDSFNDVHSAELTGLLSKMAIMVKAIHESGIKISKATFGKEVQGTFDTRTGDINLRVDVAGPGATFRTKFTMTNQEAYLHELTHAAVNYIFKPGGLQVSKDSKIISLKSSLKALYDKAGKNTKWEDLLPGFTDGSVQYSKNEIAEAKDKWEYIFDNPHGAGLHEFTAGLMTNNMFKEAMDKVSAVGITEAVEGERIIDTIQRLFLNLVARIAGMLTRTKNESISSAGAVMIMDIMRANQNTADKAITAHSIESGADKVFETVDTVFEKTDKQLKRVVEPLLSLFDAVEVDAELSKVEAAKEFIKVRKEITKILDGVKEGQGDGFVSSLVNILRAITRMPKLIGKIYQAKKLVANNPEAKAVIKEYAKMMNNVLIAAHMAEDGFIRSALRNFQSRPGLYTWMTDAILKLTQAVDGVREAVYEQELAQTKEWFGDILINNDRLNVRNNEALSDVVLRTDIQSLGVDAKGLHELLKNPDEIDKKIKALSKGLSPEMLSDTHSLASYMTSGVGLITNAGNIARGFGREFNMDFNQALIDDIDMLASYIALKDTSTEAKADMLHFLDGAGYTAYKSSIEGKLKSKLNLTKDSTMSREEYADKIHHGVDQFILHTHGLQEASKEEMSGNPHNVIKGYVKETFDNDKTLEFFPIADRKQKEDEGYVFIREAGKIPGASATYGMFYTTDNNVKRANGALGLQDRKTRGFTILDMINEESNNLPDSQQLDNIQRAEKFKKVMTQVTKQYKADKLQVNMHPMYNQRGEIVNYRVTMDHADKTQYLGMESRGTQNLARSFSTMGNATATDKHNESVITELYNDYKKNYEGNEEDYVEIRPSELSAEAYGLDVTSVGNTEYERLWARLPKGTKDYAAKLFGGKSDNKVIVVRKDILDAVFGEDDFTATSMKLVDNMSTVNRSRLKLVEKLWQDLMQIAKGNIVIKTPAVLLGNLMSNAKLLIYMGVKPTTGMKSMILASRELKRYEADKKELGRLIRDKQSGIKVSDRKIDELTNELKMNTVAPLIDAGLYQSIVEDVSTINDNNRVATWFGDKADKFITNETANTVIQYMFLTQKTKPFQQMLKATQVSDFYFRYAQYYDAIENKGQSEEVALRDAIDNYINYEAPLNKMIRYGDKMGPFFFIRYFTGIQRVIKKIAMKAPSKIIADLAIQGFVTGDTSDILDGSVLDKGLPDINMGQTRVNY